jgi:hypothetical protein
MAEQGSEQSDPISVRTHPLQITSEPMDFNIGLFSSSLLIGMVFVLVPVSLAIDMVYDREVSFYLLYLLLFRHCSVINWEIIIIC